MRRWHLAGLRLTVILAALLLPLAAATIGTGSLPRSLSADDLNAWSPVQRAGPSAYLLARVLTAAAGLRSTPPPDWFTAEDRQMLDATEAALAADKLQEAAGHLAILSSRLEERGKKTADVLPIVMPDLATYVVAACFAPVLLGLLGLVLLLLLLTPWLIRRLYDLIKALTALALAGAVLVGLALAGITLAGRPGLVYGLIEYLALAALIPNRREYFAV